MKPLSEVAPDIQIPIQALCPGSIDFNFDFFFKTNLKNTNNFQ